jgi:hypothetical protein
MPPWSADRCVRDRVEGGLRYATKRTGPIRTPQLNVLTTMPSCSSCLALALRCRARDSAPRNRGGIRHCPSSRSCSSRMVDSPPRKPVRAPSTV